MDNLTPQPPLPQTQIVVSDQAAAMPAKMPDYKMSVKEVERVLVNGDLSQLSDEQRMNYYRAVCDSLGLNYLTRPFDYIKLNNKLTLYARKDAADQLRKINGVHIDDVDIKELPDCIFVKVYGHTADGRKDVEIGVVNLSDMQGNKPNVMMKAVTKAKRRLTLSLCGLGWLDETEVETIPNARPVIVNDKGAIQDTPIDISSFPKQDAHDVGEIEAALKAIVQADPKTGRKKFNPSATKNTDAANLAKAYAELASKVFNLVDKNPVDPIITKYRVDFEAVTYDAVKIACEEWGKFVQVFGINKNTMISAGTMKMYDDMNDTSVVVQSFAPFTIKEVLAVYDTSKSLAELPIDATYGEIRETLVAVSMAQEQNK